VDVEPVFVVVPTPPASAVSRRSFLAVGFAFACGGALGSTSGFAAAHAVARPLPASPPDAQLARLRSLAVDAPVEQLVDEGWEYLALLGCEYRDDETLWFGFERLAARVTEPGADPHSRELALLARSVLARGSGAAEPARSRWTSILREVR